MGRKMNEMNENDHKKKTQKKNTTRFFSHNTCKYDRYTLDPAVTFVVDA